MNHRKSDGRVDFDDYINHSYCGQWSPTLFVPLQNRNYPWLLWLVFGHLQREVQYDVHRLILSPIFIESVANKM